MENVRDICLEAMNIIEERLKEFNISLTPEQEDAIYIPLSESIEKVAKYPDYRNCN